MSGNSVQMDVTPNSLGKSGGDGLVVSFGFMDKI